MRVLVVGHLAVQMINVNHVCPHCMTYMLEKC